MSAIADGNGNAMPVNAQAAYERFITAPPIDITNIKDGDYVEFSTTMGGVEIGVYKGTLAFRPDTHEVWANGNEAMMRIVFGTNITQHEAA